MKLIYNGREYTDEITANAGNVELKHAMVGETLTIDTMSVPIIAEDKIERLIASDQDELDFLLDINGEILCSTEAEHIPEFVAEGVGEFYFNDVLISRQYLQELNQVGFNEHKLIFYSAINKLEQSDHAGGMYAGYPAGMIIADIMGDVPYTIDEEISDIPIYGYLPYQKRRINLQWLLMAVGAHVRNSSDGTLVITTLSDNVSSRINTNRVFIGGSVVDNSPADCVEVTEHNYIPTTEEVIAYEGTTFDTETIIFSEPVHDATITNGTIIELSVNHCIFTGNGFVTIKGQKYIHVQRVVKHGTGSIIKRVQDNTLISPFNAPDVAERLYGFLSVPQKIKQEIVFGAERPGDVVEVINPYTREMVEACISRMSISIGLSELRAACEFLVGYRPPDVVSRFEHSTFVTGTGNMIVPEDTHRMRVILCSGGQGGSMGEDGKKGSTSSGGAGGQGGAQGLGGLILEINIDVTPGEVINYSCGVGGEPRLVPGLPGYEGGATTFGSYTSETGRRFPYGYFEPKHNLTIGANGQKGVDGGKGSSASEPGNVVIYRGVTYYPGPNGYADNDGYNIAHGGYGGGAAAGYNGGNGQNGVMSTYEGSPIPTGGGGGKGADAISATAAASYGAGGDGGNGGGGGGQGQGYLFGNDGGEGGRGSVGGRGGNGIIILYW